MQNMKLKALVPFKVSLGVSGPFSLASGPNEINILKLEQLNHQIAVCI